MLGSREALNSAATSKASVEKRSTTTAERVFVAEREWNAWRREGRERRTVWEIRVSILVSGGKSERLTGGRKVWEIESGRASRTAFWAFEGGPSVGITKLTARLW